MTPLATGFQAPVPSSSFSSPTQEYGVTGGLSTLPTYRHLGEDYGGTAGATVSAAANGRVVASSVNSSFGNYVVLEHTLPNLTKVYTLYAHLETRSVSVGDDVYIGQKLGGMGDTGASDGVHLHFEVSYKNLFTQAGMYGKGYDSPTEFVTSSQYTVDPSNFISANRVSTTQNGSSSGDYLRGLSTSERLYGNGGNDSIAGNSGSDSLYGGSGSDSLFGGSSSDTLVGGSGQDFLYGGSSADVFVFSSLADSRSGSTGRDTIGDFVSGSDDIDLRSIDARTNLSGDQAFTYISGRAFSGHAGELRMLSGLVQGDVNGDGVADFEIRVLNTSTLSASDFLL